ncbi:MAG: cupin domain-containing protein [Edaphobacter sp.]|uniref:cupin domain-containing protein n=1 Tax=Edaphobacter sp. TaxID=1934404 RepID=UPI002383DC81|nr:cupin domain-containing protein [Edaphobacter sp.]MDE1176349.1 cupin domain-containing protein [Edaphobacter sp.]
MLLQSTVPPPSETQTKITIVSKDTTTDAGEPITYLSTPNPEVSSVILSLPPGGKTDWMIHPVPGYLYILEGELTVEFADGNHLVFKAGQAFMQARSKWHRGINTGPGEMKFLAVFFGEKGTPVILNPPHLDGGKKP